MEHNLLQGDLSDAEAVDKAAGKLASGELLAVDNDWVHALWLDAASLVAKQKLQVVKGSDANKPYGLTVPHHQFLEYVAVDRLRRSDWELFEAHELTARTGALVFWRLPGRKEVENDLPPSLWSRGADRLPVVQNWSPEGKPNIEYLLARASLRNVGHLAVTSLNTTKDPEITQPAEAKAFAYRHRLALLTDYRAKRLMHGSYPVMEADKDGIRIVRGRPQSIGSLILTRLLNGYTVDSSISANVHPGWDNSVLADSKGAQLRRKILLLAGWGID